MFDSLRPATLDDLAQILLIEQRCFSIGRIGRRQMRYLLCHAKAQIWVALQFGNVVGYTIYLTPKAPRRARIYALAVAPEYQRQGIARALLQKVQQLAEKMGYKALALEVRCSARSAQLLYHQLGFSWTHLLYDYYADGEDGWKMLCPLPCPEWVTDLTVSAA
ncbi:GNAT family N-acetyltransferase [Celerinatantimonas yamalensis]|uniref:N-acetyltransferase n=1 Tax=Celerinatantimonas yamalensis TaxID=559956 RepID=A0ABW9G4Q7_9GAMM